MSTDDYLIKVCEAYKAGPERVACFKEAGVNDPVLVQAATEHVQQHSLPDEGRSIGDAWFIVLVLLFGVYVWYTITNKPAKSPARKPAARKKTDKTVLAYCVVQFRYKDAEGAITERKIFVTSGRRGDGFKGHCVLRNALRGFKFDRILDGEVVDVESGELMSVDVWRKWFQKTKGLQKSTFVIDDY